MTPRPSPARHATAALFTLLLLAACGGGGGGGSAEGTAAPPTTAPPVAPPTGGPAQPPAPVAGSAGVLYVQTARGNDSGYGGLDLATGILAIVRGNGGNGAAADGTEFIAIESDDAEMLDPDAHTSELVIFGPDGRATARFGRGDYIHGPARLSADRQRLAFAYEDPGPGVEDLLEITDRTGRVLARYRGLDEWDWAPDGSLYATGGDALYRIDPGLGTPVLVQRFAGDRPRSVAVSPDGMRLAFSLGDRDARRNHVWVMNADGSGLRQLTTSPQNEDSPAWSPDGRQVAVRQNLVYGIGLGPLPFCTTAWLVPADGTRVNLAEDDPATAARQARSVDNGTSQALCTFGRLDWRPAAALPARAGTPAQGTGLNPGLAGRLFFDGPSAMRMLDLATGTTTVWPGDGGSPYPSANGSEVLYRNDGANDEGFVINRSDGSVAARIPAFGYLVRPQLSPDGRTITASGWLDNGPSGIAVQLFERSGAHIGRLAQGWETSAWLPDGRLLVAVRQRLAIADAARGTNTPLATLGDPVRDLAVGPDGQRIAFTMAGHVWLMNIDGTGLRQLTVSGDSETMGAWSPDGRFVIVRPSGGCNVTVVPADGERVFVSNTSVPTSARVLQAVEDGRTRNVCAFSQPHWR